MSKSMRETLAAVIAEVKSVSEGAKDREFTDEEITKISDLKSQADELKSKIEAADAAKASVKATLGLDVQDAASEDLPSAVRPSAGAKSYGEAFTQSEAFKSFKGSRGLDGTPVNLKSGPLLLSKADPSPLSTTLPGAVVPQMQPGYLDLTYPKPNVFLSLLSRGTTQASYIQYRQLVAVTSAAAIVPEGATKPLSTLQTAIAEAHAYTVADGVKVTRQELRDDGIMASLINSILLRNLLALEEDQVLNANGTDGLPTGILNTTGVLQQDYATDAVTTIRKAITLAQNTSAASIQAVVLSPEDNEALDLLQDGNQRYYGNGPFGSGPSTIWGYPRIVSQKLSTGQAILGDFSTIQLLDREPLEIVAFNQNEDDARKNLIYVRAEKSDMLFIREPAKLVIADIAGA